MDNSHFSMGKIASVTAPNNPQNFFFQISSYSSAFVRIFNEKTKDQIHWENKTQDKQIYFSRQ